MGTAFLRGEGATKVWPAAQHQFPIYICHRGVHSKRELALYFPTNPGYQKWTQAQSTLVIWGQMLKERNRGRMLLKIRMSHAVHLTRSKVQTGAENKQRTQTAALGIGGSQEDWFSDRNCQVSGWTTVGFYDLSLKLLLFSLQSYLRVKKELGKKRKEACVKQSGCRVLCWTNHLVFYIIFS